MVRHYKRKYDNDEDRLAAWVRNASEIHTGKVVSAETRAKQSVSRKKAIAEGRAIVATRRIVEVPDLVGTIDPKFAAWVAGLADGEGCFGCYQQSGGRPRAVTSFRLTLRLDDAPVLAEIHNTLKIGSLSVCKSPGKCQPTLANPTAAGFRHKTASFSVNSIAHQLAFARLMASAPMRSKKKWDLYLWHQIVEKMHNGYATPYSEVRELAEQLRATKKFMLDRDREEQYLSTTPRRRKTIITIKRRA